ncbi:hypothetical protein LTR56_026953 [Elasticomyces elasticus]|nr:hypothetical protein LTR56_026953 [Elasticomyces elasticus]KAK3617609.1 hypothetical protein LTR22_026679 [Elasticomyces elasticus]KAK4899859.1 hypothetical protein LTR49_027572 [Elasticomyces elasticus]
MVATPQQAIRLRHDAIAENEHQNVKLWIFERCNNDNAPWVPMYCFEDNVCFLPQDFEVLNYFTSTRRTSMFTYRVLCSKFILADDDETIIVGEIILYEHKVTRRLNVLKVENAGDVEDTACFCPQLATDADEGWSGAARMREAVGALRDELVDEVADLRQKGEQGWFVTKPIGM